MADDQATSHVDKEMKTEEDAPEPEPEPQNPTGLQTLAYQSMSTDKKAEFIFDGWDWDWVQRHWENHREQMTLTELFECAEVAIDDEYGGDEHPMVIAIIKYIFGRPDAWPMTQDRAQSIHEWAMRIFDKRLTDAEKASFQSSPTQAARDAKGKATWPKIDLPAPDTAVVERQVKIGKDTELTTIARHEILNATDWFKALREQEETEREREAEMTLRCFLNKDVANLWEEMINKLSSSLLTRLARQHPHRHPAVVKMERVAHRRHLKGTIYVNNCIIYLIQDPSHFFFSL